jgi:hypothetical protein
LHYYWCSQHAALQLGQRVCRSASRWLICRNASCCWLIIHARHYCFSGTRLDANTTTCTKQQIRRAGTPVNAAAIAATAAARGSSTETLITLNPLA